STTWTSSRPPTGSSTSARRVGTRGARSSSRAPRRRLRRTRPRTRADSSRRCWAPCRSSRWARRAERDADGRMRRSVPVTLLGLRPLMPQALRWKLLPLAFVLALGAAACAEPPTATVNLGSGVRFLPEVGDSLNDAGRYPSIVTNPDGPPVVAPFGFGEKPDPGEVPITRPVGSPSIPGVFLATVSEQG